MTGRLWYFTTRIFFYRLLTIVAKFSTFFSCRCIRRYSYSSWAIAFAAESMACGHEREAVLSQLYLFSDYTETIKWHLPSPHALAHSPPSPKTSGTLSSFVNSPTAMPPATQIFPSAGGIPSLNKGLLDERATILSHSVTRSRNILWGFLYSGLILEDPRGGGYCYSRM